MVDILDKHDCCGCSACAQRCPKQCIIMQEDNEGFLYPSVDRENCIDCGLCEKVCPVINQTEEHKPLECYAAKNPDESVRSTSSSGGIFLPIAETIIRHGGIVFGACFNDRWEVVHTSAETLEEVRSFQGSKYVQSSIGTCFQETEGFLKDGRKVLFSGTPCQIAALHKYLRRDYDNLITVDVVCHGVPSPMTWRDYVATLPMAGVKKICMKDKSTGWREYSFSLFDSKGYLSYTEKASDNKFMVAFLSNLTIRPSCFKCPAKAGRSQSDITLADFWGIEKLNPSMDDNKGTSFVCANSNKGIDILNNLEFALVKADYGSSVPFNPCIYQSTPEPVMRAKFWKEYVRNGVQTLKELKLLRQNIFKRTIKHILHKLKK